MPRSAKRSSPDYAEGIAAERAGEGVDPAKRLLLTLFLVLSMASTAVARPCTDADVLVEGSLRRARDTLSRKTPSSSIRVTVETLAKTKTGLNWRRQPGDIKRQGLEDSLAETEATLRKTQALVLEPMPLYG